MTVGYRKGKLIELELLSIGNSQWLDKPAALAFIAMQLHAEQDGITLKPNSGRRSHGEQWRLWERYRTRLKDWEEAPLSERGPKPAVAAQPGWSDHEAGDAVDINRAPGDDPATPEPDSPTDRWLYEHAHEYGFVRTVPSEPWHWAHRPEILQGGVA